MKKMSSSSNCVPKLTKEEKLEAILVQIKTLVDLAIKIKDEIEFTSELPSNSVEFISMITSTADVFKPINMFLDRTDFYVEALKKCAVTDIGRKLLAKQMAVLCDYYVDGSGPDIHTFLADILGHHYYYSESNMSHILNYYRMEYNRTKVKDKHMDAIIAATVHREFIAGFDQILMRHSEHN